MKLNLTIAHVAPYIPYDIRVIYKENGKYVIETLSCVFETRSTSGYRIVLDFKLLLRPLSELTDELIGMMSTDKMIQSELSLIRDKHICYQRATYETVQILLEYHFDIFDLISKDLAININEINETHS